MMADIPKVKRNIQRMIDQGAPEADIDAYVASEGTSPDELKAFTAPQQAATVAAPQSDQPWYSKLGQAVDDMARLAANGATFGYADKIAGYMGGDGTDAERALTEQSRDRAGSAAPVAEIGGAVASAGGLAGQGLTLAGRAGTAGMAGLKGLAARSGLMAAEGAGYGALSAAGNDQDIVTGAGIGAIGGAISPIIGALGSKAVDLGKAAFGKGNQPRAYQAIMEAIQRSGKSVDDLGGDLMQAADDGQGVYTLADALGNSGQRMLSGVARSPGDMRQTIAETLQKRQGDQSRRITSALQDAAGTKLTAEQTQALMQSRRAEDAARNYAPVQQDITPINPNAAVEQANQRISPAANILARERGELPTDFTTRAPIEQAERALRDPIREALREARSYLAADTLTVSNVNQAFRAKTNIDQMIAKATENGQGAMVSELIPVRDALDETLARTSRTYSGARDTYRRQSGEIDAVDLGREAGKGTRQAEDILNEFGTLPENQIAPYRAGFFDPISKKVQGASFGTDKSRPLISGANEALFSAIPAQGKGEALTRKIGREQRMFETRNTALGGSKTADNLADSAEIGLIDPSMVRNILSGNWSSAAIAALTKSENFLTGRNSATRDLIAKALLGTGANAPRAIMQAVEAGKKLTKSQETIARALMMSGVMAGSQAGQP